MNCQVGLPLIHMGEGIVHTSRNDSQVFNYKISIELSQRPSRPNIKITMLQRPCVSWALASKYKPGAAITVVHQNNSQYGILHPERQTVHKSTSTSSVPPTCSANIHENLLSTDLVDNKPSSFDALLARRFSRLLVSFCMSPVLELILISLSCHTSLLALRR